MTKNQKLFNLKVQSLTSIKMLTHDDYTTPEKPKRVTQKVLKQLDNEITKSYKKLTPYYKRKFKLDEEFNLTLKAKKTETDDTEFHKKVSRTYDPLTRGVYHGRKKGAKDKKPRKKPERETTQTQSNSTPKAGYHGRKKGAKDKQQRKKPERKNSQSQSTEEFDKPKNYVIMTDTFEPVDTEPVTQDVIDTSKYERLQEIIREGSNQTNQNIISELLDFEYVNDMFGLLDRIDEYFSELVQNIEKFIYESESPDFRAGESEDLYTHLFILITGKPITFDIQKDINNMFDRGGYGDVYFPSSYAESVGVEL